MLFRSQGSVCLSVACLAASIACEAQRACGVDPSTQVVQQAEWEARIEAALDAMGEWAFEDVPLKELCNLIHEKLGIDVALDVKALEDAGIDASTPITRSLGRISNRSFLHLLLSELELTYTVQLGAVWITTPERAESLLTTRVYPAGDLLGREPALGESSRDWATLIQAVDPPVASWCGSWSRFKLVDGTLVQAITSQIAPSRWDFVGGPGAIRGIHDSIAVLQTSDIHEQVSEFLTAYRAVINNDQRNDDKKQTAFFLGQQEGSAAIRHALDQPFTAEFKDESLQEVAEFISERMGIPIVIDVHALEDFGIDTATPINVNVTETPLRFALVRMLNELELTYIIRDEVLFITTPSKAEESMLIGLYPVRDLVEIGDDSSTEPLGARCDFDSLIQVIESTVAPDSWEEVGGLGGIATLLPVPAIVIAQTEEVHEQISELLTKLRAVKKLNPNGRGEFDPNAHIVRSYPVNSSQFSSDEIAKLVIRASEPGAWSEEAGTFVQGLGTLLVVKHKASMHRRVHKLLFDIGVGYYKGGFGGGGASGSTTPGENPSTPNPAPGGGGGFF